MQDQYVGDIGDYFKYGLLRALSENQKLGIAWYAYHSESHKSDGKHTSYLDQAEKWRHFDSNLFDTLKLIVGIGQRKIAYIEQAQLFSDVKYSTEFLENGSNSYRNRSVWRQQWFERVVLDLSGSEIVFADPDNGLCEDEKFKYGNRQNWKRLPLLEAKRLAESRTAIIYHHNTRRAGGHLAEISYWQKQLGMGAVAIRWKAFGSRTFFIVNPTDEIKLKAEALCDAWGEKAEYIPA